MKVSQQPHIEDDTRITARLIDIICDMSIEQQLELLQQLDCKQYKSGRSDYRRAKKIAVNYELNNRVHRDFIQDISSAGVFIETLDPPDVGKQITLSFTLSQDKKPIRIRGRIVRSNAQGFAVDFRRK
ncbi:MAG TPA: PilZ domain-containing protein [Desulfobacterales bacterium]|jgi:hypothetical protein